MVKNLRWISLLLISVAAVSCFKDSNFDFGGKWESGAKEQPARDSSEPTCNTMLMVSAGFNDLSDHLIKDLKELSNNYLPTGSSYSDNKLLVLDKFPVSSRKYNTDSPPVLYHMYNHRGNLVRDTIKIWPANTPLCTSATIKEALEIIKKAFPSKTYGMVFSSHASGWLPAGYYENPDNFEPSPFWSPGVKERGHTIFPPIEPYPAVKSIGQDKMGNVSYEMELKDFAEAIPFELDYLLIDACLCGGVEFAWGLRGKARIVGFSITEVLADGFNYSTLAENLVGGTPNPIKVCQDYFEYYHQKYDGVNGATISAVDTQKMDDLASVCKTLFEKYRPVIKNLNGYNVQGYFRFSRHFFYDLKDILVNAGITPAEEAQLDAALEKCILYKAATPHILNIEIKHFSGLSMYLPSMGSSYLDNFYKTEISWNSATSLVN